MKDLLYDVVNDLADGHITKAEAKVRIDRIVRACEKRQDYWVLPPTPQRIDFMPLLPSEWPPGPTRIWCEETGQVPSMVGRTTNGKFSARN